MHVSTFIFIDGEERQFWAGSVSIGEPSENLIRIDLVDKGEIIVPLSAVKSIHTADLPEDAISPELLGSPRP